MFASILLLLLFSNEIFILGTVYVLILFQIIFLFHNLNLKSSVIFTNWNIWLFHFYCLLFASYSDSLNYHLGNGNNKKRELN